MNDDLKTIREALRATRRYFGEHDRTAIEHRLYSEAVHALAALDRLEAEQQPRKWLTDEEAKEEAVRRYGHALYHPGDFRHDTQPTIAFYKAYEWLRDNGYLGGGDRE